jgi:uncharacterized membrane protein HdeD (DUF308 family)
MPNASNAGTSAHSLGEAVERLRGKWAAITAFGVLLVVLGFAALAFSLVATIVTVTLNGVLFLIAGGAEIGLVYIAAGVLCIVNPILASTVLTLFLGAGLIAAGVVRAYLATQLPANHPRALVFVAAAVTILLGLIIVSHWPLDSVYVLGVLLGVDLLFHGVAWASFGIGLQARA